MLSIAQDACESVAAMRFRCGRSCGIRRCVADLGGFRERAIAAHDRCPPCSEFNPRTPRERRGTLSDSVFMSQSTSARALAPGRRAALPHADASGGFAALEQRAIGSETAVSRISGQWPLSRCLVLLLGALALVGCPGAAPEPVPPSAPLGRQAVAAAQQPGSRAEGAACDTGTDCASGLCEGQGCGAGAGRCVANDRTCTKDLVVYCGCDGAEFRASGSCPGQRFAERGSCLQSLGARGAPCQSGQDCESGICEGLGCGNDAPGACVSAERPCTRDLALYCGCDGAEFQASGNCPGRRYESRGSCLAPAPEAPVPEAPAPEAP